jgi:hypothetical protein
MMACAREYTDLMKSPQLTSFAAPKGRVSTWGGPALLR